MLLVWHRQRRHPPHPLAGEPERLPAGGNHPQLGTPGEQLLDQLAARTEQVLAVV